MKPILEVSAGWFHPPYLGRLWLRRMLTELSGEAPVRAESLETAAQRGMSPYRALVLYFHHPRAQLSEGALAAFERYVAGGGGVLALHSATASYKGTDRYFEILGGRFTGHGRVEALEVRAAMAAD